MPKYHPNKAESAFEIKLLIGTCGAVTTARAREKKSPGAGYICPVSGKTGAGWCITEDAGRRCSSRSLCGWDGGLCWAQGTSPALCGCLAAGARQATTRSATLLPSTRDDFSLAF